jgi:hypothetical protein
MIKRKMEGLSVISVSDVGCIGVMCGPEMKTERVMVVHTSAMNRWMLGRGDISEK